MMDNREYEDQERRRFLQSLNDVEVQPLADRQEAFKEFVVDLNESPAMVAERGGWVLNGSYGYGSYKAALKMLSQKRMNRPAWVYFMVAALEWKVTSYYARKAWRSLSPEQQGLLNELITAEIEEAESKE